MKAVAGLLLAASLSWAQVSASLSGVVRDADSGAPLADVEVRLNTDTALVNGFMGETKNGKSLRMITDARGRYFFDDLWPGEAVIRVAVGTRKGQSPLRRVLLISGQHLAYDFSVRMMGKISGRVLDEDGDPVPLASVLLVGREYDAGSLRTLLRRVSVTDDHGDYTIDNVPSGSPFAIFAMRAQDRIGAISKTPVDPKMRHDVFAPVFYPNSRDMEGAARIRVRSGEHVEGIHLKMPRVQNLCFEAALRSSGGAAAISFELTPEQLAGSGASRASIQGMAGADGKIRVCELAPGSYMLRAVDWTISPPLTGGIVLSLQDRDLIDVKVEAARAQAIAGEIIWDGKPPAQIAGGVSVVLEPLDRLPYEGEETGAKADLPTTGAPSVFRLASVPAGEYSWRVMGLPMGVYVRELRYAGLNIGNGSLQVGRAIGNAGIRVVLADGAADIRVRAVTEDGSPAAGVNVVAMRAEADVVRNVADQYGVSALSGLAPGKYFVVAVEDDIDMTPEMSRLLWQARVTRGVEIELRASMSGQVEVKMVKLH